MPLETSNKKIIEICKRLYDHGWLAACDGNVSCRLPQGTIAITPSSKHKAFIDPSELAEVDLENRIISGTPSSERLMHLAIYRKCEKAKAVVHAHPPVSIAWSIAFPTARELPSDCMSELILAVGAIPIVPYSRPGTVEMGNDLLAFLPEHRVLILARHGAVAWGEDLEEAFRGIERLEHTAKILMFAKTLGGISRLPPEEVEFLRGLRAQGDGKTL